MKPCLQKAWKERHHHLQKIQNGNPREAQFLHTVLGLMRGHIGHAEFDRKIVDPRSDRIGGRRHAQCHPFMRTGTMMMMIVFDIISLPWWDHHDKHSYLLTPPVRYGNVKHVFRIGNACTNLGGGKVPNQNPNFNYTTLVLPLPCAHACLHPDDQTPTYNTGMWRQWALLTASSFTRLHHVLVYKKIHGMAPQLS